MNETHPSRYEPLSWLVLFTTSTSRRWIDRLVPGRYKHVMAAAWIEASKVWIFYDVQFTRTRVMALPESEGLDLFGRYAGRDGKHGILRVEVGAGAGGVGRLGFWCVPAVKHLLGLRSGALRPDRLWRDCIAAGAEIIHEVQRAGTAAVHPVAARAGGSEGG